MTFTKERLQKIVSDSQINQGSEFAMMARQLLATMEQEPVAYMYGDGDDIEYNGHNEFSDGGRGVPLYAAPPAPVVPETLPCPVMLEPGLRFGKGVRTQTMLDALQCRAEYSAELEAMTPEQRADHEAGMKEFAAMLQGSPALHEETQRSKCWCRTCRPVNMTDMRFVVCPECGNKRCPRANDCSNVCSGSNEPGQESSAYPAAPQQEVK